MAREDELDRLVVGSTQAVRTPDEPDILIGAREQILHLLAEAAEIEHALMCSYLYALFSLKPRGHPDFSAYEDALVEEWRQTLRGIAIEEMGHLLIVANLSVALGGLPHFARPNFPVSPGYFPSGVAARLTAFSLDTLEHFIFLERPCGMSGEDAEGFATSEEDAGREQAWRGLMPGTQDYATVSHLYAAIRSNILAFVERAGEEALFVGGELAQIGPEELRLPGIEPIRDSAAALRGIDLIIEQGEGSAQEREDSHYRRFRLVKSGYEKLLAANPDFAPAWPCAPDPVLRRPPAGVEGLTWIDALPAAQVLDFCNACYGLLLRLLVQVYSAAAEHGEGAEQRKALLGAAFSLMHVLARSAEALAGLPASEQQPGLTAGMTFTMLRGVEPFVGGRAQRLLILERLQQLADGARLAGRRVPQLTPLAGDLETLLASFRPPEG